MVATIRNGSTLDCLSYVGHGHVDLSPSTKEVHREQQRNHIFQPSWAPVWNSNVRESKTVLRASSQGFNAFPRRSRETHQILGSVLIIRGIILDEVMSVIDTGNAMSGFHSGRKRSYLDTEGVKFWETLLIDSPRYSSANLVDAVYGPTLTLGTSIHEPDMANPYQLPESPYQLSDFLAERFGDKLRLPGRGMRLSRKFVANDNDMSVSMRLFMDTAVSCGTLRFFIRTKTGYVGMAPHVVEVGDKVAILAGSKVPVILRSTGDGQFVLLGDAYVHGIMFGEAIEGEGPYVTRMTEERQIIIC